MKPSTAATLALLRERPAGITAIDALSAIGSFRLAGRIHELRADGYAIEADWLTTPSGKRVCRYRLVEPPVQQTLGIVA